MPEERWKEVKADDFPTCMNPLNKRIAHVTVTSEGSTSRLARLSLSPTTTCRLALILGRQVVVGGDQRSVRHGFLELLFKEQQIMNQPRYVVVRNNELLRIRYIMIYR